MKLNFFTSIFFMTLILMTVSCVESDDPTIEDLLKDTIPINFESALLKSFTLSEVEIFSENVSISQPIMVSGVPQNKGKIIIQIPHTEQFTKFSLKQVHFDSLDFTISPAVGEQSIILGKTITYTITSSKNPYASLQYDVLVTKKTLPLLLKN